MDLINFSRSDQFQWFYSDSEVSYITVLLVLTSFFLTLVFIFLSMAVGARGGLAVGMEDRVTESGSVSVRSVVSGVVAEGLVRCGEV